MTIKANEQLLKDAQVLDLGLLPTWRPGSGLPAPSELTLDSSAVRELLLHLAANPHELLDPRGLRVRGAIVTGPLNLAFVISSAPLHFDQCVFVESIDLTSAHVPELSITSSQITSTGSGILAVFATSLRCDGNLNFGATSIGGFVDLDNVSVGGNVNFSGTRLGSIRTPGALFCSSARIDGDLNLGDHFQSHGPVILRDARIEGSLFCSSATMSRRGSSQEAFSADRITVNAGMWFTNGFTCNGVMRLNGASIRGQINFRDARLIAPRSAPYALVADHVTASSSVWLSDGFVATGALRFSGIRVGGQFIIESTSITEADHDGDSLVMENATLESDLTLRGRFSGALRLIHTRISGHTTFDVRISSSDSNGISLNADYVKTEGPIKVSPGFWASGVVRFREARVRSSLEIAGATVGSVDQDPPIDALDLYGIHIDANLSVSSSRFWGAVDLSRAVIGGDLFVTACEVRGSTAAGFAILADSISVGSFSGVFRCKTWGGFRAMDAKFAGRLAIAETQIADINETSAAIEMDRAAFEAGLNLGPRLVALGKIRLNGAKVRSQLTLRGLSVLSSTDGKNSIDAGGMVVEDGVWAGPDLLTWGPISFQHAKVHNGLRLHDAHVHGATKNGASVNWEGLRVTGGVDIFRVSTWGCINLRRSTIEGNLALEQTEVSGTIGDGSSLSLAASAISGSFHCGPELRTSGAIDLSDCEIAGQLRADATSIRGCDSQGVSLNALRSSVGRGVTLGENLSISGRCDFQSALVRGTFKSAKSAYGIRTGAVLDLRRAEIHELHLMGSSFYSSVEMERATVGLLSLPSTPGNEPSLGEVVGWRIEAMKGSLSVRERDAERWLRGQPSAQPLEEVASSYERQGYDAGARWLRYKAADRTAKMGPILRRLPGFFSKVITGHGFYPGLAAFWLLATLALSYSVVSSNAANFTTPTTAAISTALAADRPEFAQSAPGRVPFRLYDSSWDTAPFYPSSYTLSAVIPSSPASSQWAPPNATIANVLLFLRLLTWILTALFLAAVTGLLRRRRR